MDDFRIQSEKASSFYSIYERKGDLQSHTHYCPGCGHGIAHKLVARAIDELGIQDRVIFVSPVGCSVFAYYYFDTGNVQAAHGRAPAVATGIKRARPGSIVIAYQGDGDLAAIGSSEILHAANRGEAITVFFINNAIYGMTGGQMAPTTPIGAKSTTSPFGRSAANEGYPLHVCELLSQLKAPVYLERVGLGNSKQVVSAYKAVKKALTNQVQGIGFSLVEILSPCPTIWKMKPIDAQTRVREELTSIFPLGVYRDETEHAQPHALPEPVPLEAVPAALDLGGVDAAPALQGQDLKIRVAGFGGQGVLMLGEVIAEAGLASGHNVSWLPSYGPEMRSGTSNCHVRVATHEIDSPVVSNPNVLLALNEPSLRKFAQSVEHGGWIFYNGSEVPEGVARTGVRIVARPFTELADSLGDARAANIVMLGALMELTGCLSASAVDRALTMLVKGEKWLELDRRALARGREEGSREVLHETH